MYGYAVLPKKFDLALKGHGLPTKILKDHNFIDLCRDLGVRILGNSKNKATAYFVKTMD
jgi:hypothetical protein